MGVIITSLINHGSAHPHQPYKWSLIRWEDQTILGTVTIAGAPSFQTTLCEIITTDGSCWNVSSYYFCPSSNPGRSYCNFPNAYFCAYWGCETIASDWIPGAGRDKFLQVEYGPYGCKRLRNCNFLYLNVTNPNDQAWLLGKTWGVRYYENGLDRGGLILIKKEVADKPQAVGPNEVLSRNVQRIQPAENATMPTFSSLLSSDVAESDNIAESNIWEVMNASYQLLNKTNPNMTEHCRLCFSIRPPYYDAIGDLGELTRTNESNPLQCNWGKDIGVTLAQVTGSGRCVGTVPGGKRHLCDITENGKQSAEWLIPNPG